MFDECGGVCADCKGRFDQSHLRIDHIIPIHQGGAKDPENLQLLCVFCSDKKRVKDRLFAKCGGICADCKVRFGRSNLKIVRIIPVHQGGTNDPENLQLLCSSCASKKSRPIPDRAKDLPTSDDVQPKSTQPIPDGVKGPLPTSDDVQPKSTQPIPDGVKGPLPTSDDVQPKSTQPIPDGVKGPLPTSNGVQPKSTQPIPDGVKGPLPTSNGVQPTVARQSIPNPVRDRLFDECGGVCASCKRRFDLSDLQIDLIIPLYQRGTANFKNLQLLCGSCVSKKAIKDQLSHNHTQKGMCAGCKFTFDLSDLQRDHIIPVNRGGTNNPENMQLLCSSCSSKRRVKDQLRHNHTQKGMCAGCKFTDRSHLQRDHIIPVNQGGTDDPENLQLLCESCISKKEATPNERQPIPKWVKAHLFQECGGECAGCMDTFRQMGNLQIDHIIPVHLGGTNELENLQLLCSSCNSRKGTGTMPELIDRLRREGIRT